MRRNWRTVLFADAHLNMQMVAFISRDDIVHALWRIVLWQLNFFFRVVHYVRPYIAPPLIYLLQANNVNTLPWSSRSPDLVSIEHVWHMLN